MESTATAEAAGDPVEALRIHESFPPFADSPHSHVLRILAELGDDAPGWLWSRWMTIQAHRGDMSGSHSGPDPAVGRAIDAAYIHGVDLYRSPDLPPEMFGVSLHQFDWIVRQLRVYEGGGLRQLVDERASVRLLERSAHIADWVTAPMRGLQLVDDPVDLRLPFTDLATGERVELLDLASRVSTNPAPASSVASCRRTCRPGRCSSGDRFASTNPRRSRSRVSKASPTHGLTPSARLIASDAFPACTPGMTT